MLPFKYCYGAIPLNINSILASCRLGLLHSIGMLLVFICSSAIQAETLTEEQKVQIYDEAVHILGGNANVISRWHGDVNYYIVGSNRLQTLAKTTLLEVTGAINLNAIPATLTATSVKEFMQQLSEKRCAANGGIKNDTSCPNFIVVQSSREDMLALATHIQLRKVYQRALTSDEPVHCFFAPYVSTRQIIEGSLVYVNSEIENNMLQTCLNEEIYQSFGLFNDFSGARFFSFNNSVRPKTITDHDKLLLKTLYDSVFRPGTPVFSVMKRFLDELNIKQP